MFLRTLGLPQPNEQNHSNRPWDALDSSGFRFYFGKSSVRDCILLREYVAHPVTVDLKYLTRNQVIEVVYESESRRFVFGSASTSSEDSVSGLADGLSQMSVEPRSAPRMQSVWTVGWDTAVSIEPSPKELPYDEVSTGHILRAWHLPSPFLSVFRRHGPIPGLCFNRRPGPPDR